MYDEGYRRGETAKQAAVGYMFEEKDNVGLESGVKGFQGRNFSIISRKTFSKVRASEGNGSEMG